MLPLMRAAIAAAFGTLLLPIAITACGLALVTPAARAAPVAVQLDLGLARAVRPGNAASVDFDLGDAARRAVGGGAWVLQSAWLWLDFSDDADPLQDLGPLGDDGSETLRSAARTTRDGRSGIVTFVRTTEYQARAVEDPAEVAQISATGLQGSARSASRQVVLGTTTPVLRSSQWSGWTCHWWGCAGTSTELFDADRLRGTLHDGAFGFEAALGAEALADLAQDGLWRVNVGATLGDFVWQRARLVAWVDTASAAVPLPGTTALLAAAGLAGLAARRRSRHHRADHAPSA